MTPLISTMAIGVLFTLSLSLVHADNVSVSATFSDAEIRIIADWYGEHSSRKAGKPGKGKRGGLPPGIAKNLARGKSLPPGIAKQYLPEGLRHNLPAPPAGHERIIVDGRILLIEVATQVIRDVLMDVFAD